jgi:phosphodiesterase/alkaline phosphatase D-like protein
MADATVAVQVNANVSGIRLKVATDAIFTSPVFGAAVSSSKGIAKPTITGLAAATLYYYKVQKDGADIANCPTGTFRTKPAASFKCCFGSCVLTGSNHAVFDTIRAENPDFFIHMGDRHYKDIAVASDSEHYEAFTAQKRWGDRQKGTGYKNERDTL